MRATGNITYVILHFLFNWKTVEMYLKRLHLNDWTNQLIKPKIKCKCVAFASHFVRYD